MDKFNNKESNNIIIDYPFNDIELQRLYNKLAGLKNALMELEMIVPRTHFIENQIANLQAQIAIVKARINELEKGKVRPTPYPDHWPNIEPKPYPEKPWPEIEPKPHPKKPWPEIEPNPAPYPYRPIREPDPFYPKPERVKPNIHPYEILYEKKEMKDNNDKINKLNNNNEFTAE